MKNSNSSWWFLLVAVLVSQAVGYDQAKHQNHYEMGRIYDITHRLVEGMPEFGSAKGSGPIVNETRGRDTYYGVIKLNTHMGTHVDSPGHLFDDLFQSGYDVDYLDLRTLNGPVLVVDTPKDKNITADILKSLDLPKGVKRVIFKTLNTDRRLMNQRAFASDYTGFTTDGAEWLVNHTDIKFVGIDYMSIARKDEIISAHKVLLGAKDIIPVENLKLDEINPGSYVVHCLPLRLPKADGSPARPVSPALHAHWQSFCWTL